MLVRGRFIVCYYDLIDRSDLRFRKLNRLLNYQQLEIIFKHRYMLSGIILPTASHPMPNDLILMLNGYLKLYRWSYMVQLPGRVLWGKPKMFVCSMLLCYLPQRAPLQCKNRPQGKRTTVFTHFSVCRTRLWLMSDNALFPQLSAVSAACPNSRAALLAAEIQNVYGTVIGTTLRTSFAITALY
jgi:hypothetical protein